MTKSGYLMGEEYSSSVQVMINKENGLRAKKILDKEEQDWEELVRQGKAKLVATPILRGVRYHYERI